MSKRKLEDTLSVSGSSVSDSEISVDSVIEELNEIIERSEEISNQIQASIKTLDKIESLIASEKSVIVKYDEFNGDFNELIEVVHKGALENISENGVNNFGQMLLDIIENGQFI